MTIDTMLEDLGMDKQDKEEVPLQQSVTIATVLEDLGLDKENKEGVPL